jgi:uncharacterized membrane protein YfcA
MVPPDLLQSLAALASGAVIGAILGLLGAGGSILAVPLLVYFVGVSDPHTAIGTGAAAVAGNALLALWRHARRGNVRWPCGLVFATAGVAGAWLGTLLGKAVDGRALLAGFGAVMILVGVLSLRTRSEPDAAVAVRMTPGNAAVMAPKLGAIGFGVGAASGFFGVGGGFLVVPGLVASAGLPLSVAMGTSLVAVSAFGLTALASYAGSGLVDWPIAGLMTLGGLGGAILGGLGSQALETRRRMLAIVFSAVLVATGLYVIARSVIVLV